MKLNKVKVGSLIEQISDTNNDLKYGEKDVKGMTIYKEIIPTKADTNGADLSKYIIIKPKEFVYNPRTHGKKIGLGYNDTDETIIISWNNIGFKIKEEKTDEILPDYLFLNLNRDEWDRQACFQSWGSSTEVFSWNTLCDMEIDLPDVNIQQKYVNIYQALIKNQKLYEKGLDDLKLVCDGYIENLRKNSELKELEHYIIRYDERNKDNKIKNVKGVSTSKEFKEPTSKVNREELSSYKIVHPGDISFVQTTHNEKVFANALNNTDKDIVVTSVNEVFKTDKNYLLPEYLVMFFNRKEFDRYARFHSWGSARETFTWNDLIKVKIPIPNIEIQKDIVNIYNSLILRKKINEELKNKLKEICPILIKGSIEEAKSS